MVDRTPQDWESELSDCFKLLSKNKIIIIMYEGKVGGCKGIFRHVEWEP